MVLELDAREVLAHLNSMGYHEVTAEQLKEFMKDLRKLIKYEEQLCPKIERKTNTRSDKLHKATTISFQGKTEGKKESRKKPSLAKPERSQSARNRKPACKSPNEENHVTKPEPHKGREPATAPKSTPMWIRPRSCSPAVVTKSKGPVQLYQFYKKEWDKFKHCLPGENDHAELRWKIRHKLLGVPN